MSREFKNPTTQTMADFVTEIGIEVISTPLVGETFLPGVRVEKGKILADEARLTYPGDILHEAGHLAVVPGHMRSGMSGEVELPGVVMEPVEAQAIAWSYAAIVYLGLDPKIIWHPGGYRVESERLQANFDLGVYIGVNGLQEAGLAVMGARAIETGIPPYPHMIKWLRD